MKTLSLLKAEIMKYKRTSIIFILIIIPLLIIGMSDLVLLATTDHTLLHAITWTIYITEVSQRYFLIIFLLFVTILASFSLYIEEQSNAWKRILTYPVSRNNIILVKFYTLGIFIVISHILFIIETILSGYVLQTLQPELSLHATSFNIGYFGYALCLTIVPALFILAIQLLLGILFNNYIFPVMGGLFAIMATLIAGHYKPFLNYFPWIQPFHIIAISGIQQNTQTIHGNILLTLGYSFVGMIAMFIISIIVITKKDII